MTRIEVIILAGGRGVRMNSDKPKSLQNIGGRPMLQYILSGAKSINSDRIHVVYGSNGEQMLERFSQEDVNWCLQSESLGTGHATQQAISHVDKNAIVCVLYGDNPFVSAETISKLVGLASTGQLALLTAELENPTGYGRIKRDTDGTLERIIEDRDASESERKIREINAGPLAVPAMLLTRWLARLNNDNKQKEYYLTDIVDFAVADGITVATTQPSQADEIAGVNSRIEQAQLERVMQMNNAESLLSHGVEIVDPARFDLRGTCESGKDCRIDINVILEGEVRLGDNVTIEANNVIKNTVLGAGVTILPNCVIDGAQIESGCTIGPFARIRPGTVIGRDCRVGNYVEIKNSTLGEGTKVNHLAYVGDSDVGQNVNIGAGTITCNYDGKRKHRTVIGNNAFIGSNASLVAPLEIGAGAVIGAGSTITKDVDSDYLAVERSKAKLIDRRKLKRK